MNQKVSFIRRGVPRWAWLEIPAAKKRKNLDLLSLAGCTYCTSTSSMDLWMELAVPRLAPVDACWCSVYVQYLLVSQPRSPLHLVWANARSVHVGHPPIPEQHRPGAENGGR